MTLYDLTQDYQNLMDMACDPDIDEQTLSDTLEAIDGEIEDKADGYAKILKQMEGEAALIKAEEERMAARRKSIENRGAWLKARLSDAMIATGKTKFKTSLFSFGIQKNAPSLDVLDESSIPEQFWKPQEPKLDRKSALDYIKQNGDQEWGQLKQTESLRIR